MDVFGNKLYLVELENIVNYRNSWSTNGKHGKLPETSIQVNSLNAIYGRAYWLKFIPKQKIIFRGLSVLGLSNLCQKSMVFKFWYDKFAQS